MVWENLKLPPCWSWSKFWFCYTQTGDVLEPTVCSIIEERLERIKINKVSINSNMRSSQKESPVEDPKTMSSRLCCDCWHLMQDLCQDNPCNHLGLCAEAKSKANVWVESDIGPLCPDDSGQGQHLGKVLEKPVEGIATLAQPVAAPMHANGRHHSQTDNCVRFLVGHGTPLACICWKWSRKKVQIESPRGRLKVSLLHGLHSMSWAEVD